MKINGEDINRKRKELGITQKELAEILGVSYQTIQNWESGKPIPKSKNQILQNYLLNNKYEITYSGIDTISERLMYFQVKNGLTYYDTGSVLGLTQGEMRGLINRNEVTEEYINAISEKFGISKKWFLTGEGEMPRIKNKEVTENLVAEPRTNYEKEDNSKITILEKENELLKENNTSLKEINELLKKENMRLESENENLKKN